MVYFGRNSYPETCDRQFKCRGHSTDEDAGACFPQAVISGLIPACKYMTCVGQPATSEVLSVWTMRGRAKMKIRNVYIQNGVNEMTEKVRGSFLGCDVHLWKLIPVLDPTHEFSSCPLCTDTSVTVILLILKLDS